MHTRGVALLALGVATVLVAGCADDAEPEVAGVVLEQDEDVTEEEDVDEPPEDVDEPQEGLDPGPEPLVLGDTVSALGVNHRFEDDGAELGSGQVLESDEVTRHLVADVLLDGDRARCQVSFHAPSDRGLVADGELVVELVLEERDGQLRRVEVETLELDVALAAGESYALPPTPAHDVETAGLRALWCEARHR